MWRALRGGPCPRLCAAAAPGCAPRPLHYYSHTRGPPTRALVGGRPIASPRNVLGHGQRLSRVAAAAGPPLHRLTLNSTHRTQSQNTAPDATHGHGLLRLTHAPRLALRARGCRLPSPAPLPAQIKHLRRGGGDERPAVAVRARVVGDGSPIERKRSRCGGGGEAGKPPADPQKDAVARSRAGGGGGEGEARGARRCWRRRWRGRRRSRSGGERVVASKTPVRAARSPF